MQPEAQPESIETPAAETVDTFDGGKFNPDELPAELQPGWKQLQAAFTQRTQELAEQRKQLEALGDPESLQQAVELYQRIADPQNWGQLHAELTGLMREFGMTPAEAEAEATRMVEEEQGREADSPDLDGLDDPELAPLVKALKETQARLAEFESAQESQAAIAEAQRMQQEFIGQLTRQENAIREANPQYGDEDVDMSYELSSFYNGNLLEAQARLEGYVSSRIEKYLAQKAAAAQAEGTRPVASAAHSNEVREPQTLEEAAAEAEEALRQLVAAGEVEL